MAEVHVIEHPLVQHKLAMVRDRQTGPKEFRELVEELAMLLAYEVTREFPLEEVEIETPICRTRARMVGGKKVAVIPILRAGLGMTAGILRLLPTAKVGHIGVYRDPETLRPVAYYCKLPPDLPDREIILVDPMLATGGSAVAGIDFLKERGANIIKLMCLIGAPEGVKKLSEAHPDVSIYLAALDDHLNDIGYIVPGLGDAVPLLLGAAVPLVAARLGVPAPVVARMVANLAIDALVGTMPLLGDAFDVVWRAHRRNVRLLEVALADPHRAGRRSTAWWLLGIGLVAGVVLLLATALVVGVVEVVRRVPLW